MVTQKRGRPPGRTARGEASKTRFFELALAHIATQGYEATTLRGIAAAAGTSHAAVYRHFPSKQAILVDLYDALSQRFAADFAQLPSGPWSVRFVVALRGSLTTLQPHRGALQALLAVLMQDPNDGLFAPRMAFSRARVTAVFVDAVAGAQDAPPAEATQALGRTLYMLHLAVLMGWFLDRSIEQGATQELIDLLSTQLKLAGLAMRLAPARRLVARLDSLLQRALVPQERAP